MIITFSEEPLAQDFSHSFPIWMINEKELKLHWYFSTNTKNHISHRARSEAVNSGPVWLLPPGLIHFGHKHETTRNIIIQYKCIIIIIIIIIIDSFGDKQERNQEMSTKSWIFHFAIKNKEITSQRKPEFERYSDNNVWKRDLFMETQHEHRRF